MVKYDPAKNNWKMQLTQTQRCLHCIEYGRLVELLTGGLVQRFDWLSVFGVILCFVRGRANGFQILGQPLTSQRSFSALRSETRHCTLVILSLIKYDATSLEF